MQGLTPFGQSPSYSLLLSQRLRNQDRSNNGTIPGGLAHMLNQGVAAFVQARDAGQRQAADQTYMDALTKPQKPVGGGSDYQQPNAPTVAPGVDAAIGRLSELKGNPYAGRLTRQLAMQQMAREQEAAASQRAFQQQLYRDQMNNRARIQASAAGRPVTNISTGVPNDPLMEALGKKQAETWAGYMEQGDKAGSLMADLDVLDDLADKVPSGPLEGRFAEMFPELDSNASVFQSITSRLAPQMRVPGSGASSDKDVDMFLRAQPRLRYGPKANRAIVQMFRDKAQIDGMRSDIVAKASNGEITPQQARAELAELNRRRIMPPELQNMIDDADAMPRQSSAPGMGAAPSPAPLGTAASPWPVNGPDDPRIGRYAIGDRVRLPDGRVMRIGPENLEPDGQKPPPPGVDPDLWRYMTPEERALW